MQGATSKKNSPSRELIEGYARSKPKKMKWKEREEKKQEKQERKNKTAQFGNECMEWKERKGKEKKKKFGKK